MEEIAKPLGLTFAETEVTVLYFCSLKVQIKLNFGLSLNFSVQLKVSLSKTLSECTQKYPPSTTF